MKQRKAVSEIISAIIVITVVVAGLGLYTGLSQQRILGDALSVKESIDQREDQISELMEFIDMFRNETNSDIFQVYVNNYGFKNITISNVYVNGTLDMSLEPNSFYVRDLAKNIISPNNQTIPVKQTSELILNFINHESTPNIINNIVIITDSNNIMQFVNGT